MVFDESSASETRTRRDAGRRSTLGKYAVVAGAVVTALLLFGIMGSRFGKDLKAVRSPLIGQPAPAFELELLEASGQWSLDQHRGSVVVVNFWASWCLGCRLEHDDLLAASAAYQDRGVVFVGVVFQDEPSEAIAFLDELGRGYPSLLDPGSRTAVDYGVWAIPETYFIDRDGVVRSKISGESDFSEVMSHLDAVLALDGP